MYYLSFIDKNNIYHRFKNHAYHDSPCHLSRNMIYSFRNISPIPTVRMASFGLYLLCRYCCVSTMVITCLLKHFDVHTVVNRREIEPLITREVQTHYQSSQVDHNRVSVGLISFGRPVFLVKIYLQFTRHCPAAWLLHQLSFCNLIPDSSHNNLIAMSNVCS